jgi:DNA primase
VVPLTPRYGWDEVKGFAEAMARILSAEKPDRYLADMSKSRRKGRIFVDYLRNGRGATAIAPFSSRARKGAPVSWPIAWSALGRLENAPLRGRYRRAPESGRRAIRGRDISTSTRSCRWSGSGRPRGGVA